MGVAEFVESSEEVGNVGIMEEGVRIIMIGKAIGAGLLASGGAGSDVGIKLAEDKVEGEGSEYAAEGAALGKSFELLEERPEGVGSKEPAGVGFVVEEVKEWEETGESWVGVEDVADGFAGDGVEHILDVEEEHSMGGWEVGLEWAGYVGFK